MKRLAWLGLMAAFTVAAAWVHAAWAAGGDFDGKWGGNFFCGGKYYARGFSVEIQGGNFKGQTSLRSDGIPIDVSGKVEPDGQAKAYMQSWTPGGQSKSGTLRGRAANNTIVMDGRYQSSGGSENCRLMLTPMAPRSFSVALDATTTEAEGPQDYDGVWSGTYTCNRRQIAANFAVVDGKIELAHRQPDGSVLRFVGEIATGGTVSIKVVEPAATQDLIGRASRDRAFASGQSGGARCDLSLNIVQPAIESLQARWIVQQGQHDKQLQATQSVYERLQQSPSAKPSQNHGQITECSIAAAALHKGNVVRSQKQDKPRLFALTVGVGRYRDKTMNLELASKDACDVGRALLAQQGGLYGEIKVRVLLDESATKHAVVESLEWLMREAGQKDVAMLFLGGHGVNDATGEYFFLPHDADIDNLEHSALAQRDIRRTLQRIAGKALFFIDTCHSGQIMGSRRAIPPNVSDFVEALATAENGAIVFSASTGRQFAIEDASWGNGAFTKALLEGLSGAADYNRQGVVTVAGLEFYIAQRVRELTGGRQSPTTAKPSSIPDFPIALVR